MYGTISHGIAVNVAASEAWKLYGTLGFAKTAAKLLPDMLKVDVVEGDGAVGTILKISSPGVSSFSYKEKFTVIDNEKRVKETEVVEGVFFDLGYTLYRLRLENIETGDNTCITKCTIEYELKPESAANIAGVNIAFFVLVLKAIADYLTAKKE